MHIFVLYGFKNTYAVVRGGCKSRMRLQVARMEIMMTGMMELVGMVKLTGTMKLVVGMMMTGTMKLVGMVRTKRWMTRRE